jgi:hypothetical protein
LTQERTTTEAPLVVRLRLRGAIALVLSTALAVAGCGSDVSG